VWPGEVRSGVMDRELVNLWSQVRLPTVPLMSGNILRQVVHTRVLLSRSSWSVTGHVAVMPYDSEGNP